jgi:hypothetical protein
LSARARLASVCFGGGRAKNRITMLFLASSGGEGFEPSIRLTTDNGFRDRNESAYLQYFSGGCPARRGFSAAVPM